MHKRGGWWGLVGAGSVDLSVNALQPIVGLLLNCEL